MHIRQPFLSRFALATVGADLMLAANFGVASAALNNSGYATVTKDVSVPPNDEAGAATAKCPTGYVVVSGGAYWHAPNSSTPAGWHGAYLESSAPTKSATGWYASGRNFNHTNTWVLRVTAQCLPQSAVGAYTVKTREVIVDGQRSWQRDGLVQARPIGRGRRWCVAPGGPQSQREPGRLPDCFLSGNQLVLDSGGAKRQCHVVSHAGQGPVRSYHAARHSLHDEDRASRRQQHRRDACVRGELPRGRRRGVLHVCR